MHIERTATQRPTRKAINMAPATKTPVVPGAIQAEKSVPKIKRIGQGRKPNQDTLEALDALKASVADGLARSYAGITADNKEEYARKVRAADKLLRKEQPTFKATMVFDPEQGKLFFGPETVIKELVKASS